jgi:hypothetical protein
VDISLISGLPPSISIFAFGYFCWSCFLRALGSVFFPTFALTFVPSGVCTTLIEYPVVGDSLNIDSASLKREPPNSSSIRLRFFLRDMAFTKYLMGSCVLKVYQRAFFVISMRLGCEKFGRLRFDCLRWCLL